MKFDEWNGFTGGDWEDEIDVRDFIQKNYTPYTGDDSFWLMLLKLQKSCGKKF